MDRWLLIEVAHLPGESTISKQSGIRLYDGDSKSVSECSLELSSHRLLARAENLCLDLHRVVMVEKEEGGFMRSDKVVVHVLPLPDSEKARKGPDRWAEKPKHDYCKLSFRSGGQAEFFPLLQKAIADQAWIPKAPAARAPVKKEMRAGITGIQKNINKKNKLDQANISKAFKDLDVLIEMAKPMVHLANSISSKIRDKQGGITEDETVQFKSYLLSLGIDDPVTKDSAGSDKKYYEALAQEMFLILDGPIQEAGGMITLTDAFVRVNRARGLELVSPDDLLCAARALATMSLPLMLHTFPTTGVMVLKSQGVSEEEQRQSLCNLVESLGSLTPEELGQQQGLSVILARERLVSAENEGALCRDDTVEGLRFYPNEFLAREAV